MTSINRKTFLSKVARVGGAVATGGYLLDSGMAHPASASTRDFDVIYHGEVFNAHGATLNIAQWGGIWQTEQHKVVLDKFQKDFNCKINYDPNFPYYPKLVAGGMDHPPYDLINQNLPEAFLSKRFYVPVEEVRANVPNAKDIWPFAFRGTGIIWSFSQYGYAYRTDLVKGPPPRDFRDIWQDRFKGKRGTYDTTNTLEYVFFMVAAKVFGGSPENIKAGLAAMQRGKPWVVSHFTGNMQSLLTSGEVAIAVLDDGEAYQLIDKGVKVRWMPWTELKPVLVQNVSITRGSKNKRLAYALLNRYCSAEVQQKWAEIFYFRPTNRRVKIPKNLASKGVHNTADAMSGLWVPPWDWWNAHQQSIIAQLNPIL